MSSQYHTVVLLVLLLVMGWVSPQSVSGDTLSCGHIITPYDTDPDDGQDDDEYEPITDCENPFGVVTENPDIEVFFGDTRLIHNGVYPLDGAAENLSVTGVQPGFHSNVLLYRHEGDDYVFQWTADAQDNYLLEAGTYTVIVDEEEPGDGPEFGYRVWRWFFGAPVAHADSGISFLATFEVTEEMTEEPLDPLLLEYLPILRMHPDEEYVPMNVEAFVAGSALWDDKGILPDEVVRAYDAEDPLTIEELLSFSTDEDFYLAFSSPEEAKSLDLSASAEKYNTLVDAGDAATTVYARKMEDSFEDSFGDTHEYIVLQYWYFYAMNDWHAKGGLNNHEGDWESVFVFLDADTEEPQYVAFSAHHNDGEPDALRVIQYDSVRRSWNGDEIEKDDTNVISYVALGSHANYPKAGEYQANVFGHIDATSNGGLLLETGDFNRKTEITQNEPDWLLYQGKWGSDQVRVGWDGPQGPAFIDVGGHLRFHEPLAWAGIDKIERIVTEEPETIFSFPATGVGLSFAAHVPAGTELSTTPYFEPPQGSAPDDTQLLDPFWDIESDLENETFEVEIRLPLDREKIEASNASPQQVHAYWHNPETGAWEKQPSTLDESGDFVVFSMTHFSRFALGVEEVVEVVTPEETKSASGGASSQGTRVSKTDTLSVPDVVDLAAATQEVTDESLVAHYTLLRDILVYTHGLYEMNGYLSQQERETLMQVLVQISDLLKTVDSN